MIKKNWLFIFALFAIYFSTRLIFLLKLPIFTDEAIYIRWGQIALQDQAQRFISLEDGKQPLFIWLMLPLLKFAPDPLLAGRLISVIAGAFTLLILILLSKKLFGDRVSRLTGILYIISPFFLQYDRLAIYDSLTTAITICGLYIAYLLAISPRLDLSLLLGLTTGAGLLTKTSTQFILILLPSTLLVFNWTKSFLKPLAKWVGLVLISVVLALLFQTFLRVSPLNHMVNLKNHEFIVSFSDFLSHPFARSIGNLSGLYHWTSIYYTWPYTFLLIIGIFWGLKKTPLKTILLISWWAIPLFALASFAKILYPRFVLFMFAPLLPLSALGLNQFLTYFTSKISTSRLLQAFLCLSVLSYPIYFSSKIIFDPINAPLPQVDKNQFVEDWPSGYGVREIIDILKQKSQKEDIFVGTEGTFGLTPSAFLIYLKDNQHIQLKGYWPINSGIEELVTISKTGKPTYVIFKDTQKPSSQWPLEEIAKFQKGHGNVYMSIYQVLSRK